MKLVQFLRPLFLVALGLHGLLLFIPTGESDPAVIEDIALDERPESDDADLLAAPPVPGNLPVPDPNVSTKTAPAGATANPAQTRVTARAATTPARPATRARPPVAPRGAPRATPRATPNTANTDEDTTANSTTDADSSESSQTNSTATDNNQQTAANGSGLPDLSGQQAENNDASEENASAGSDPTGGSRLTELASGVIRDFPDAVATLEALVAAFDKSLTYSEIKTTDESAQRSRDQWTANLQQQANTSSPESIDITEISDALQITYPLQVSENLLLEDELKEHLNGREISVCLEEEPSNAEVGILFDAQGDPAEEPTILRSTGYMLLDEEIKARVMAPESLPSGSPLASGLASALSRRSSAYILEVSVNYDKQSCVSLSDLQKQGE